MTLDHRLSRLEYELGIPSGKGVVRLVRVQYDPACQLAEGELDRFLEAVSPDRTAVVFMLGDNGRDPCVFPSVTVSGDGWTDPPLPIHDGRIVGDWRGEA